MKSMITAVAAALVLWTAGQARAEFPAECKGEEEPSAETCGDITAFEGCCHQGQLLYCVGGKLYCFDCTTTGGQCGWDGEIELYMCGTTGTPDPSGAFPMECPACTPACAKGQKCTGINKCAPCAADECGGTCNDCPQGQVCDGGKCCLPSCAGKQCGADGCGGSCGQCGQGLACIEGQCGKNDGCIATESPGCPGCGCETCVCAQDDYCCMTHWDALCIKECQTDCGGCVTLVACGDGKCTAAENENCANCPADCPCPAGQSCYQAQCCAPNCAGKECGDDGCGGQCGVCPEALGCTDHGQCVTDEVLCGVITHEGCCDGEMLAYCSYGVQGLDCSDHPSCGWSAESGYYDCGTDGGADPSGANPKACPAPCQKQCAGKQCGDDGCGGSCGQCAAGTTCVGSACLPQPAGDVTIPRSDAKGTDGVETATPTETKSNENGGCAAGPTASPAAAAWLFGLSLLLLALPRRRVG